jgi:TusA-related sulfurtransferase
MTGERRAPDRVLDAPGLACTSLTPLMSSVMAQLPPGALLEVRTGDPAARMGVPAWCRLTHHPLHDTLEGPDPAKGLAPDQTVFHITKKEQ